MSFKEKLTEILAENCNKEFSQVSRDVDPRLLDDAARGRGLRHH